MFEQYTIFMQDTSIPTIVIDDTPVKRRGICDFVEETPQLRLHAQLGDAAGTIQLVEKISEGELQNPTLAGWLVLSDLRLGNDNGVELGRALLEVAPGLRVVVYTQDPSWTLATEVFRREYTRPRYAAECQQSGWETARAPRLCSLQQHRPNLS